MPAIHSPAIAAPTRRTLVDHAVLILVGAGALAAAARINLPLLPVPVTAQTFVVLLLGALLGSTRGSLSVLTYLAAGAAGLPVFAAGGGPEYLIGPTGGYLVGFLPAAYLTGALIERGWGRRSWTTMAALLIGDAAMFAFGLGWLAACPPPGKGLLQAGLVPFLPGEALKIAAAAVVLGHVRR